MRKKLPVTWFVIVTIFAWQLLTTTLPAADWPVWRGPELNGISPENDWDPAGVNRVLWQKDVGPGWTTVTVHQGHLLVMGNLDNHDVVHCLDPVSGAERWTARYPCNPRGGGYAGPRATPVTDGERVYAFSQEGHASCFDLKTGRQIWQRHLPRELKVDNIKWQFSAAPLILDNAVIFNAGEHGVALDKNSGKTLWQSNGTGSYAVPVPFKQGQALAIFSAKGLIAVDAKTGRRLWDFPWITNYDVNAPDPLFGPGDQWVFITSGYGRGCAMLDLRGDKPKLMWENKNLASHFASPVLHDGRIYGVDGNAGRGRLACLDPKTGKRLWHEDLGFGSFVIAGQRLIYLDERGKVTIGEISPDGLRQIAAAPVLPNAGKCWTMPVLANGLLYCRGSSGRLVCLDLRK